MYSQDFGLDSPGKARKQRFLAMKHQCSPPKARTSSRELRGQTIDFQYMHSEPCLVYPRLTLRGMIFGQQIGDLTICELYGERSGIQSMPAFTKGLCIGNG